MLLLVRITAHSFSIGAIQEMGCWHSSAVDKYIRIQSFVVNSFFVGPGLNSLSNFFLSPLPLLLGWGFCGVFGTPPMYVAR